MTDNDQSIVAAPGPHHPTGENSTAPETSKPSIWDRIRGLLTNRNTNIREDLAEALEGGSPSQPGSFSANERTMLQNVLNLGDVRVDDVMVPRADIEAVDASDSLSDLILQFKAAGHSRLPVYKENLDNIIGFVHIKDVMERITSVASAATKTAGENDNIGETTSSTSAKIVKLQSTALKQKIGSKRMVRQAIYVPPSMPVGDLLQKMQATRVHMAIVVDEYGGTDGLVTIEDLLEAVVGDIEDEHDDNDGSLVRTEGENTYVADARVELAELQEAIGPDFDPSAHTQDADTLGGLIFDLVDRVPVRGEVIGKFKGFEFVILSADARRIRQVRIMRKKRPLRIVRTNAKTENTTQAAE